MMPKAMDLIYVDWAELTFCVRYFVVSVLEAHRCQQVNVGLNQLSTHFPTFSAHFEAVTAM